MGFWDFMFGKKDKMKKVSNFDENQQQGWGDYWNNPIENSQMYGAGSDYLQSILSQDPQAMKNFERPFMENFEQNIAPGIAERFAGMGTGGGASSSSALNNSLAQAGRGLQSDIAAMRSNLGMQASQIGLNYAQQPYNNMQAGFQQRPFENVYQPGTQGFLSQAGKGIMTGIGYGVGGPMGGAAVNWGMGAMGGNKPGGFG